MRQCLIVCTNDATTSEHFGLVLHLLTLFAVCVCVRVYHSAGGGGREEEDELFDEGSLRSVTVLDN